MSEPASPDSFAGPRPAPLYSLAGKRVWVAGHGGMVGAALVERLKTENCEVQVANRRRVDLRRQQLVEAWLARHRPQAIFLAAARVGGINANNTRPAEFLYDNLMIAANIISAAPTFGVEKLLFLGSSCVYPKMAPQPITEDALLTGPLEPTNQWYAIAKIAGAQLCQAYRAQYGCDFITAMPTNLYGPRDNFDLRSSHALPALIAKAHRAKLAGADELVVWGTGTPKREFLHVHDVADALVYLMKHYSDAALVNVGVGEDISIADLARLVAEIVGFRGTLRFDPGMPDGTPRKLLDVSRLSAMGWGPRITLRAGIQQTYDWYLQHHAEAEAAPAAPRGRTGEFRAGAETSSPSWQAR
jgi:GDP-L-fucose synthase